MLSSEKIDAYPTRTEEFLGIRKRQDPVTYGNSFVKNGPLNNEIVSDFERNGFLFFPGLFSESEIEKFKDEIEIMKEDESLKQSPQCILEQEGGEIRSVFEVHKNNPLFSRLASDKRIVDVVRQLLDSDVYVHQSRINLKPGFEGREFFWHSDFETWHSEDGMPRMRAISCSINLTENFEFNGPLMVIPNSHKDFVSCTGKTPENHYMQSLKRQEIGTPDRKSLIDLVSKGGIVAPKGPAGSVVFFDCNIMHGSNGNITPYPRSNVFFVFNSVHNTLEKPFCAQKPRPEYIASRDFTPITPKEQNFK